MYGVRECTNFILVHVVSQFSQCYLFWSDKYISSVQFSHPVVSDSLQSHRLQHSRLPCPSPTPEACSKSCPLSQWCHPIISSSIIPFSSCPQSFPSSESFPMSQLFTWGGQSIRVSAHRLKKSKICERNYNYNYQQKDKHKDLKQDIKITKCGGGE